MMSRKGQLRLLLPAALLGLVPCLPSCRSSDAAPGGPSRASSGSAAPASQSPTGKAARAAARSFGAALEPGVEALPIARLLAAPDSFAARTVTVEAQVRRNCIKKGCWMEIAEGPDLASPGCRVTFKDYGFFVPLDSAGAQAKVSGIVEVKTVTPGEVAHLEAEGARFAGKQPDGSAREIRIVATGVELRRDPG